jgi:predicted TIM-barrel fold metal-dependent hydrolase
MTVIDALFSLPARGTVSQITDCGHFTEDLAPQMLASGVSGAVLAHGNCALCQHQWNCADRRTHEVMNAVAQNPRQLRGLAAYDPLLIGESLRWIDEASSDGRLAGAYLQAECCAGGLAAPRMYPLYGTCAKLRVPIVIDFDDRDRWTYQRPQVELVAADFPELDILLATPAGTDAGNIMQMMQRFPRVSFLLGPQELHSNKELCEYVELPGRERALFRSANLGWPAAIKMAKGLALRPGARRAYLSENAIRLFSFPVAAVGNSA